MWDITRSEQFTGVSIQFIGSVLCRPMKVNQKNNE